jgi:hypothetical protein
MIATALRFVARIREYCGAKRLDSTRWKNRMYTRSEVAD